MHGTTSARTKGMLLQITQSEHIGLKWITSVIARNYICQIPKIFEYFSHRDVLALNEDEDEGSPNIRGHRCVENGLEIRFSKHHKIPRGIGWKLSCEWKGVEIIIPETPQIPKGIGWKLSCVENRKQ